MSAAEPKKESTLSEQEQARVAVAKAKLLDGWISAISVDACIFTENGNRLGHGVLGQLEKINSETFTLVFSDVTLSELIAHIESEAEESKTKLRSALRSAEKHWKLKSHPDIELAGLLGEKTSSDVAKVLVGDFTLRSKPVVLEAEKFVDIRALLDSYFLAKPPFEKKENKKSEFPDAIALMALERWAIKNNRGLMFVTKDKGCKSYCDGSVHLFAVHQLSEALALIGERDKHLIDLCASLTRKIKAGLYPSLCDDIEATINRNIWDIDWSIEADAPYYYEEEVGDIYVSQVELLTDDEVTLRPISFEGDILVVKARVNAEVRADVTFSFSIRDTIDHDWMPIGGDEKSIQSSYSFEVLITFESADGEEPEVSDIELISKRQKLDFGYVEPDFRDEDPTHEYY